MTGEDIATILLALIVLVAAWQAIRLPSPR
jgi:hypothetical protein